MPLWYNYFNEIGMFKIQLYLITCIFFITSFYLGSFIGNRIALPKIKYNFKISFLNLVWIPSVLISIYFIYKFKNAFFKGYFTDVLGEKGPFIALSLILLFISVLYLLKKISDSPIKQYNFFNIYSVYYLVIGILILSLGGRLYFLSSIIIYVTLYTVYVKPYKINFKLIFFVVIPLLIGVTYLSLWRLGIKVKSFKDFSFYIFAETLFTSFSSVSYLAHNDIESINWPGFLVNDLKNLIPSFLYPSKIDELMLIDKVYNVKAPLGAFNNFVSFITNFGVILSSIVFSLLGFLLSIIKKNKDIVSRSLYVMICGFLTFTFFRDPFSVSVVKCIIEFSILVPLFIIILLSTITYIFKKINATQKS
jgi:hypothetical protein